MAEKVKASRREAGWGLVAVEEQPRALIRRADVAARASGWTGANTQALIRPLPVAVRLWEQAPQPWSLRAITGGLHPARPKSQSPTHKVHTRTYLLSQLSAARAMGWLDRDDANARHGRPSSAPRMPGIEMFKPTQRCTRGTAAADASPLGLNARPAAPVFSTTPPRGLITVSCRIGSRLCVSITTPGGFGP